MAEYILDKKLSTIISSFPSYYFTISFKALFGKQVNLFYLFHFKDSKVQKCDQSNELGQEYKKNFCTLHSLSVPGCHSFFPCPHLFFSIFSVFFFFSSGSSVSSFCKLKLHQCFKMINQIPLYSLFPSKIHPTDVYS